MKAKFGRGFFWILDVLQTIYKVEFNADRSYQVVGVHRLCKGRG